MRSTAFGEGGGLLGGHRPIEQRKKDQLVGLDIDGERLGGLDRGAPVERRRPSRSTRRGSPLSTSLVSGLDIGEPQLGGRACTTKASSARAGRARRATPSSVRRREPRRAPPQQPAQSHRRSADRRGRATAPLSAAAARRSISRLRRERFSLSIRGQALDRLQLAVSRPTD